MSPRFRCALSALASATVLASASASSAQWMSSGSCGCNAAPSRVAYARPVSSCSSGACGAMPSASCAPAMQVLPVTQQCYRTVPVTEYQQVRQTVRRPVTEVEYIEQPQTVYRPVTETRTVDVPVTTYQDVVEYQQVSKQGGNWVTNYQARPKMTACEYDCRQNVFGMMNRAGYSVRSAFTPSMVATREFVPQTCVQQVPITRRIPQTAMQQQSYQVTKYVPETTTQKVAVNKVRWVEEEVVALKPVTVMKTIASGTQTSYAYAPLGATILSAAPAAPTTSIGVAPKADPISNARREEPKRTAVRPRTDDAFDDRGETDSPREATPRRSAVDPTDRTQGSRDTKSLFTPVGPSSRQASAIARVGGWRATNTEVAARPAKSPIELPTSAMASTR